MATEIERKFLVRHTDMLANVTGTELSQGYLSHTPEARCACASRPIRPG